MVLSSAPSTEPLAEEVEMEAEEESVEGEFLEFSGLSGIDDVEELAEESPEPSLDAGAAAGAEPEPVISFPELSQDAPSAPLEEITSETLADLYLSQELPDRASASTGRSVEEPGNERVAMKLNRALASQRTAAGAAQAAQAPRVETPVAATSSPVTAGGRERAAILIARLEEWLTTIGERRRGIH